MKFKLFQKQDLARAALHDGLILSWDTGLWKTGASYMWPCLKCGFETVPTASNTTSNTAHLPPLHPSVQARTLRPKGAVLMVVPGDLHDQTAREGLKMFNVETRPLNSQEAFQALTRREHGALMNLSSKGKPVVPPGFYITSYTQLTTNGVDAMPDPDKWDPLTLQKWLCLPTGEHVDDYHPAGVERAGKWEDRPNFESVCHFFAWRGLRWADQFSRLDLNENDTLTDLDNALRREQQRCDQIRDPKLAGRERAKVEEAYEALRHLLAPTKYPRFQSLASNQRAYILRAFLHERMGVYGLNNGTTHEYPIGPEPEGYVPGAPETDTREKWRVKCLYSPSLADLCYDAFDCVTVDEGVKMKGEETIVGKGVRSMRPKYRLVLTATPVKNRLTDIFRLAWWAAGGRDEAHARWPYRDDSSEREKFANTFMVSERNLTKQAKEMETKDRSARHILADIKSGAIETKANSRYKKLTAQVCNVHRLWKLFGPIVLRRRKDDCGEDIVPKIRKVVRCEMGTEQQRAYAYHLQAEYIDCNGQTAVGAKLQALRMAAADPASEHLHAQPGEPTEECTCRNGSRASCTQCQGTGRVRLPHVSTAPYIPKYATTLTLIQEILERKEQVVVFSAFNDPLDKLSGWLDEAQVRHVKLDGRTSQKKRGTLAANFKLGRGTPTSVPVMLAGVECMAEGHSFHLANNVILIAYSWAYDKFIQAINRVHRMNSPKPVNVYVVICNGTIDRKLESLIGDKGDAAELVLDGRLIGERTEEINLAELLQIAQQEFAEGQIKTIDESMLERQWPALRANLALAMQGWEPEPPNTEIATARQDTDSPFHQPSTLNHKPTMRRTNPIHVPKSEAPTHRPPTATVPTVPTPSPAAAPSWRERMKANVARLAQAKAKSSSAWADL